ncbi:MAG: peroxiredoxin [Rhodospirillaceae bacterium]
MTISTGSAIPDISLFVAGANGPQPVTTGDIFSNKRVVLFGLPGAFTPTCSTRHLPGYLEKESMFKEAGIDQLVCMSVNDAFVIGAWARQQEVNDRILMLADGNGDFASALGLNRDMSERGMGERCHRFALIANDARVQDVFIEPSGSFGISSAENVLTRV